MARRRTWAAGLVAAGIVTSTFVAPGVAAALPGATASGAVGSPLSAYPAASFDNDALYDEYIRRVLYGDPGIQLFGTSAYDRMGEDGRRFYDVIAQAAREIASGERSRTDGVALPTMTWTYDELGAEPGGEVDAAFAAYRSIITDEDVVSGLLDDNPYDFYWYDKSGSANDGSAFAYRMAASANGSSVTVSATASLAVASAYRADPSDPYAVDAEGVQAATRAAENARAIVERYADLDDYDKLEAYKDEICDLASYNHDAASDPSTPYGDPWQLVYVFDGDDGTSVVCEGYAKAFQYLCDLSTFDSDVLRCTTVRGTMQGGTGDGAHMWNVVRMDDGRNYLVDVTNSDEGTIGQGGELFIASTITAGDLPTLGYTFVVGDSQIVYIYDKECIGLYHAGDLVISPEPYDGSTVVAEADLSDAVISVSASYTYDGTPKVPEASTMTVTLDGARVAPDAYSVSASNNVDAGTATVTVTARSGSGYTGSVAGTFQIARREVVPAISGTTSKVYDGGTSVDGGLSISLDGLVPGDDVTAAADFAYVSADAGADKDVRASNIGLAGEDAANYQLSATELTDAVGTVERATPEGAVSYVGAGIWPTSDLAEVSSGLRWSGVPAEGSVALSPDAELVAGTHDYACTFTPTSPNYVPLETTVSLTVSEDALEGIAVTTPPDKTSYLQGESFDPAGMVVVATYESGRTEDVTESAFFSPTKLDATGSLPITISYEGKTTTVFVTVTAAGPQLVKPEVALIGAEGLVYDCSPKTPGVSVTVDGEELDPSEYVVAYANNVDAGTATVTVSDAEGSDYEFSPVEETFQIARATPWSVALTPGNGKFLPGGRVEATTGVYFNSRYQSIDGVITVSLGDSEWQVSLEDGVGRFEFVAPTEPGTYEYSAVFPGSQNFEPMTKTTTLEVAKGTPRVSVGYAGGTLYPATAVDEVERTLQVTSDVEGTVSLDAERLQVGTHDYAWTFTPSDTTRYEVVTGTVSLTVSPLSIAPTIVLSGAEGLVYTGLAHEPAVTLRDGDDVIPAGEYVVTYSNNVDAGTATVTVSDAEGGDYEFSPVEETFQIARATPSLLVSADAEGAVVGDGVTVELSLTGVAAAGLDGTVVVTVDGVPHDVAVSGGSGALELDGLDAARTYEVTASYAGSGNYEAVTASTSFSLSKATPEVSVGYTGGTLYPATPVDEVERNLQVTSDVEGTVWIEADRLQEGTHDYVWVFSPADRDNYNVVTGALTLTVSHDDLVGISATAPTKTAYTYGEAFDPAGMVVTVTYASGRTADVTDAVSFDPALVAGQTSVTLSYAEGGVERTVDTPVTVSPRSVEASVVLPDVEIVYDASAHEPVVALYDGDVLIPASEYVVTYEDNVDAGTATVRISDVPGGNYVIAETTATFEIARASYGVEVPDLGKVFDGFPIDLEVGDVTIVGYGDEVSVSLAWYRASEGGWVRLSAAPSEPGDYRLVVTAESDDPNYESVTERSFEFSIAEASGEEPGGGESPDAGEEPGAGQGGDQSGEGPGDAGAGSGAGRDPAAGSGEKNGPSGTEAGAPALGDAATLAGSLAAMLGAGVASVAAALGIRRRS